jgi:uncharacterized ion transporter superfamily protein YfcC
MIALIRLAVFGFIGLSVIYLLVSIYSRSVRREKLEDRWDSEHEDENDDAARNAFIEEGMQHYEHGLRKQLIWLVFIIPMVIMGITVYLVNYQ